MDPEKNIDEVVNTVDNGGSDEVSVDDFIKQLEEKEKDLHITLDTSIIEIAESFDDGNLPDFLKDALDEADAAANKAPVAASVSNADKTTIKRLEVDLKNLQQTIAKMEADREEMFSNSRRRAKDFEAFKVRSERERKETFQSQIGNVAILMLPALDNLQRALDSAEHMPGEKSDGFQQFYEGIGLVSDQINDILSKMGITPIRTIGEEFDPHFHEAVATDESGEYPQNTITGEIRRGYIAGDRVIRHSMVKVAMGAAKPPVDIMPSSTETPNPELS